MTDIEQVTEQVLEKIGFVVKPFLQKNENDPANIIYSQVPVGKFRIDFALLSAHIAIEVQGTYWHGLYLKNTTSKQLKRKIDDLAKQNYLTINGWQVLYFTKTELMLRNILNIMRQSILDTIEL